MDLWPWIIDERRALLATFESLEDGQWDTGSLCGAWTVREVLAHVSLAAKPPLGRYLRNAVRHRCGFDEVNRILAVDDARRPIPELLDAYRAVLENRFAPRGWPPAAPLSDAMLHGLDVRIPLGLPTERPAERYEPVLDLLLGRAGRSFAKSGRPDVRWTATDRPGFARGEGLEVTGPIEALALSAAGRGAWTDRLDGPGAGAVRTWLA